MSDEYEATQKIMRRLEATHGLHGTHRRNHENFARTLGSMIEDVQPRRQILRGVMGGIFGGER